uniref:SDR family NAD(P)-dependent oxidoreductase n=1 Tax=uncultured Parasphingopyxis sp. TaxID=1547918 RepID=UPI0026302EE7
MNNANSDENKNKWVWVTGASRGLGLSIAKKLLDSGFSVLAASRTSSGALQELISEHSERIVFKPLDLSVLDGIHSWC